ncbi:hypothetical protein, partial [Photorhabdus sp. RM96S]|uniref:hypothetical protein n=1 Tax=Photorhabdus sp. RM96S TaxID=3342822 RepID=UPI0036DB2D72
LGIIFSLLSIQITGCPKSVIEFNLMLEKVTSTLLRHPLCGWKSRVIPRKTPFRYDIVGNMPL